MTDLAAFHSHQADATRNDHPQYRRGSVLIGQADMATPLRVPQTVTSGTRPGSPADGDVIYETDTGFQAIYDSATTTWCQLGKVIEQQDATTQTGGASADFTYNSAGVSLTAGRWEVQAGLTLLNTVVADTATCAIWNNTGSVLVASSTGLAASTSTTLPVGVYSLPTIITVTSTTVYRPRGRRAGASTIQALSTANSPAGWIRAICLGTT